MKNVNSSRGNEGRDDGGGNEGERGGQGVKDDEVTLTRREGHRHGEELFRLQASGKRSETGRRRNPGMKRRQVTAPTGKRPTEDSEWRQWSVEHSGFYVGDNCAKTVQFSHRIHTTCYIFSVLNENLRIMFLFYT